MNSAGVGGDLGPLIGAFEADAWAGLVFVLGHERGLSLRLAVEHDGHRIEPRELFIRARDIGPCAPDGTYARVGFDLTLPVTLDGQAPIRPMDESEVSLTWEWARLDPYTVAIRISALRPAIACIQCGAPWDWHASWRAVPTGVAGWVTPGGHDAMRVPDLVVHVVEPMVKVTGLPLRLAVGQESVVLLATVAPHLGSEWLRAADLHAAIDRAARDYAATRTGTSGAWRDLDASIANNIHWMVLLQPERVRPYAPAGRRWIFPREAGGRDDWTIFAWDGFFNALLLSLEAPGLAHEMLASVIETQYPSGNIPNWRGRFHGTADRSQPPVGSFVTLKLALRTGDRTFARATLPALHRWHAWWQRRRRPTGLYAWGSTDADVPAWVPAWERGASHRQKAAWESGQDDLPNWDDAGWDDVTSTLAMECVDLSALIALDAECLAQLCDLVGDNERAAGYRAEHGRLCALIDDRLWDATRGVFADRRADGGFSPRIAASNFLPLLAGVASGDHASRALETLLDPERFWGRWVVPTIDRRDPAFGDQQYWRGTIWPPTNFLIYEALKRLRADGAASELAGRSVELFLGDWRAHQVCRENFSSIDGVGGGQRHQSWGPLFSWTGMAEFADVTPWDGLRIGTSVMPTDAGVERLSLAGRRWDIAIGPDHMTVACNGEAWFEADGPVCLRGVTVAGTVWRASASVRRETRVRMAGGAVVALGMGETRLVCTTAGADNPR